MYIHRSISLSLFIIKAILLNAPEVRLYQFGLMITGEKPNIQAIKVVTRKIKPNIQTLKVVTGEIKPNFQTLKVVTQLCDAPCHVLLSLGFHYDKSVQFCTIEELGI